MTNQPQAALTRLSESGLELADLDADVRGRKVVDRGENEVGQVDDLIIDPTERRVRFLLLGAGGFLGIGERKLLIPVDAVTDVGDVVQIEKDHPDLTGAPAYDPTLIQEPDYYEGLYNYYGYLPFWAPGYHYPPFPLFRP